MNYESSKHNKSFEKILMNARDAFEALDYRPRRFQRKLGFTTIDIRIDHCRENRERKRL